MQIKTNKCGSGTVYVEVEECMCNRIFSAPYHHVTGDPVTLVTPPHTDQCDYCMCIRLVNKHNESKHFQCNSRK